MAAWSDHEHAGEPKTPAEPVNLAGESKQAADQRQLRAIELRLAREALAGPLGSIERARLVERIAELDPPTPFTTPHVVCTSCAHQVTVTGPVDRCENCGSGTTWLEYHADPDACDERSGEIADEIAARRRGVKFTGD